jgi:hypothetical protein
MHIGERNKPALMSRNVGAPIMPMRHVATGLVIQEFPADLGEVLALDNKSTPVIVASDFSNHAC